LGGDTAGSTKGSIDLPADLVAEQPDLLDRVFAFAFDVLGWVMLPCLYLTESLARALICTLVALPSGCPPTTKSAATTKSTNRTTRIHVLWYTPGLPTAVGVSADWPIC
jgi:hypothetical protein